MRKAVDGLGLNEELFPKCSLFIKKGIKWSMITIDALAASKFGLWILWETFK